MSIQDCIYQSYNPTRKPSHKWRSWHNHTGCYPRFSFCPTVGLSIARYRAAFEQDPDVWESFAITDHAFSIAIPDPAKSWPHAWYENLETLQHYVETGETQRRFEQYREFGRTFRDGVRFFQGIEIESDREGHTAIPLESIQDFDVIIASIHHNPGDPAQWVERHFFQIDKALKLSCDIIGHPIRHLRTHSTPEQPLAKEIINETLDRIKRANVAVEINAHYSQIHDDVHLLQGAYERGMKVAFSMDLHYPEEFGNWRYFEDVVELSGIAYEKLNLFTPERARSLSSVH